MEYNWADPRKNKRVDSVMMAKAEASRVKRLTSVKSTVSNQLNPAVEHKLKTLKKKKGPETLDERPSSRLHQREFDLGNNNSASHSGQGLRAAGGSGSSSGHHSFYNEFLPQAARPKSIFDSFDVHAAADGLFHPASNVQAFAEHDAKYAPARDKDSGRSAASSKGGDKRLPPLSGHSDRSERLASRSESRLLTASSAASSYRSLTGLGGNRSDGDLHAPRRVGIVPSSADRHAMELLGELDDDDDSYPYPEEDEHEPQAPSPEPVKAIKHKKASPSGRSSKRDRTDNNSDHHDVPPLELDLAQKFAKLKSLIKTNREKHETSDEGNTTQGPEVDDEGDSHHATASEVKEARRNDAKPTKSAKNKVSRPDKKQATSPETTSSDAGTSSSSAVAATSTVPRKPKSTSSTLKTVTHELKVRSGVSLSDLKEEHRAALAMLQELGGPLDEHEDASRAGRHKVSRHARVTASSKETSKSKSNAKTVKGLVDLPQGQAARPSGSADRNSRLVEKLRARIPSAGRDKPTPVEGDGADSLQGKALVSAALDAAREVLEGAEAGQATGGVSELEHRAIQDDEANERLWERYGGDEQEDGGEEEDDDPSAELYDDEAFEG